MREKMSRTQSRRRGVIAILVAFMLTALVGMTALAVDGGMLMHNKRGVQAAADAAALAGASQIYTNYPTIANSNGTIKDPGGNAKTAALSSASSNGFNNDGTTNTVTVNIPPKSGPFTGKTGYVEVIISYQQPRYFSTVWGSSSMPVQARAVALGRWGDSGNGVIVLDPSVSYALDASGGGAVTVNGGANMVVDSNNSSAARATGGGSETANNFRITGGYVGTFNGTVQTGTYPIPDPLRYLPTPTMPPAGTMTTQNLGHGNKQYTFSPGSYSNLPNFNAGDVVVFQQASANSYGGIFYINGGGFTSTGATITMDSNTTGGIMIYNAPSSSSQNQGINISGNSSGTVNLSPLTSGPYAGMILWQDRSSTVSVGISGNGNFTIEGTMYAASANMQITGNGNATIGSQYISDTLSLSGNGNILIDYSANNTARIRTICLVE